MSHFWDLLFPAMVFLCAVSFFLGRISAYVWVSKTFGEPCYEENDHSDMG